MYVTSIFNDNFYFIILYFFVTIYPCKKGARRFKFMYQPIQQLYPNLLIAKAPNLLIAKAMNAHNAYKGE